MPPDRPPIDAATMARAFALAQARMSAVPAAVSGYRLFWVRGDEVGWKDLPAGGPYAILGSHEQCDGVLPDPGVELRHVLATTVELADGPALRLLDLHSDMPFCLQDGSYQRSVVGAGPVLARLGWTVFGGVPIEAGEAPEGPAAAPALPDLVLSSSSSVELPPEPIPSSAPPRLARVTSMPPSSRLAELPPRTARPPTPDVAPSAVHEVPKPPPGQRSWALTLERAGRAASVSLTDEELALGVVIGRSLNCHDQGLRAVLGMSISRGHLLLLHHHETYEAFDLRSVNGTWEEGRSVGRRRLEAEPVTLALSSHAPVVLHWHGRG